MQSSFVSWSLHLLCFVGCAWGALLLSRLRSRSVRKPLVTSQLARSEPLSASLPVQLEVTVDVCQSSESPKMTYFHLEKSA